MSERFNTDYLPWLVPLVGFGWSIWDRVVLNTAQSMVLAGYGVISVLLVINRWAFLNGRLEESKQFKSALSPRNLREAVLPSISVASTLLGSIYLVRSGGKLIKKR